MKDLKKLEQTIDALDYAYQPIVSFDTGKVIGFEALLRGVDQTEYKTIDAFFDATYENADILADIKKTAKKSDTP